MIDLSYDLRYNELRDVTNKKTTEHSIPICDRP